MNWGKNREKQRVLLNAALLLTLVVTMVIGLPMAGYAAGSTDDSENGNPGPVVSPVTSFFVPPTPTPPPTALETDLVVDDMPISRDEDPGYVLVNLPLKYKMNPINHYSYQLQYLEVFPVFDNPDESPFELDSSQLIRSLMDLQTTVVNGRTVTYLTFPFRVKEDTPSGYYAIKFHTRFMHQGGSMLYDKPTEADVTVNVHIEHGATPTPTPTPTPSAGPQAVPKVIISSFKTDPEIIMTGDEFDLTLSLYNTSTRRAVSNIKCTIDGGEVIVPVSGSNTFYIPEIEDEESYDYDLRMSAQPVPASSTSTVGKSQHTVRVKMEYEYTTDQLTSTTVEETFTLRVRQEVQVDLNPIRVEPTDVSDGDYFDVTMSLINKGKASIYNLTARYEGPSVFVPDDVFFGGLVNPGESKSILISCSVNSAGSGGRYGGGGMVFPGGIRVGGWGAVPAVQENVRMSAVAEPMPAPTAPADAGAFEAMPGNGGAGLDADPAQDAVMSGPQECFLIVTYEDEYGNETREEVPFTVNYTATEPMDYGDPGLGDMGTIPPDDMGAAEGGGISGWLLWGGIGIFVAAGAVVTVLILRARKRRQGRRMGGNAVE